MFQNPKFLFRLHMARNRYREAAKIAIILANNEQVKGTIFSFIYIL